MISGRSLSSCSELNGSKTERIRNRLCAGGCQDLGNRFSIGGRSATRPVQSVRGGELPARSAHCAARPWNSTASGAWTVGCSGGTEVGGHSGTPVSLSSMTLRNGRRTMWRDYHGISARTCPLAVLFSLGNWAGATAFWAPAAAGPSNSSTGEPVAVELRIAGPMDDAESLAGCD